MTPEEIKERFEALSYLKIHPRDREENKYLLLKGGTDLRGEHRKGAPDCGDSPAEI